ncbi:MAG TPA: cytochrome c oxidase assembly protein, partial [Bacillales bacterium]|nr:cytochrome c oxidase assembly protein [Bacillales bacterium]
MHGPKPSLTLYNFSEMWHPALLVALAAIAVLYYLLITRWRIHFPGNRPAAKSEKFYFSFGLVLYYAVEGSPWKVLGEYMFSAHMITMTIAYLCVPPLILLGIPKWFWKPVLRKPVPYRFLRFFTRPFLAVVFFNVLFSLVHLPLVFNSVMESPFLMAVT